MNAHVEEHEEGGVAAPHPLEEDPAAHRHDHVVDHVQRCQLVILLFQNHEEGIHEVGKLRKKVPPHNVCSAENTECLCGEQRVIRSPYT